MAKHLFHLPPSNAEDELLEGWGRADNNKTVMNALFCLKQGYMIVWTRIIIILAESIYLRFSYNIQRVRLSVPSVRLIAHNHMN